MLPVDVSVWTKLQLKAPMAMGVSRNFAPPIDDSNTSLCRSWNRSQESEGASLTYCRCVCGWLPFKKWPLCFCLVCCVAITDTLLWQNQAGNEFLSFFLCYPLGKSTSEGISTGNSHWRLPNWIKSAFLSGWHTQESQRPALWHWIVMTLHFKSWKSQASCVRQTTRSKSWKQWTPTWAAWLTLSFNSGAKWTTCFF